MSHGKLPELSAKKRELLARLMRERGLEPQRTAIPRREQATPVAASAAQERLWFLQQLDPDGSALNMPAAFRLRGPLNIEALERSLVSIVSRHEVLRTTIDPTVDGRPWGPWQIVH